MSESARYILLLDIEAACLGWGLVQIDKDGVVGPNLAVQEWFEKGYSIERAMQFWTDAMQEGERMDGLSLENAITIVIDNRHIDISTLKSFPEGEEMEEVTFLRASSTEMILADGFSRVFSAAQLAQNIRDKFPNVQDKNMLWVAKFYDLGRRCSPPN
jgi:uncharacterized protein (DUF1015 family)